MVYADFEEMQSLVRDAFEHGDISDTTLIGYNDKGYKATLAGFYEFDKYTGEPKLCLLVSNGVYEIWDWDDMKTNAVEILGKIFKYQNEYPHQENPVKKKKGK